jgi:phage protein D
MSTPVDQLPEITVTATRPYLNTVPALSAGRQPCGIVKVNGQALPGWVEWQFDNNTNYQADTFRVTFAGRALLQDRNVAWLTDQGDITVEILAGFPQNPNAPIDSELTSFIIGRCDDMLYDPIQNTIELAGRDFTSQFIDAKTTETFINQSVQSIVKTLASRHQMRASVSDNIVPPATFSGNAFEAATTGRLTNQQSEWDLLTHLAQETQCSVYVTGQTLNFQPAADPTNSSTYVIDWKQPTNTNGSPQANVIDLRCSRNLTLTKDIIVELASWDRANSNSFLVTAKATQNKNRVTRNTTLPYGQPQIYSYQIPELTTQQALVKAKAYLAQITSHEKHLEAHLPGDNILTAQTLVTVRGTGTSFDQVYFVESVIRSMSMDEGYRMKLAAKNHSPQQQVTTQVLVAA